MASTLPALILAAFVVCCVQGQVSQHDAGILIEYVSKVNDAVTKDCSTSFGKLSETFSNKYKTDHDIDTKLCDDVKKTSLNNCKKPDLKYIQDTICNMLQESSQDRADRVIKYQNQVAELSTTCKAIDNSTTHNINTWYGFEQYCKKIEKTDKKAFEKACTGSDYGDLKDVVCGGAMGLLSGLLTLGLCFLASLINKL